MPDELGLLVDRETLHQRVLDRDSDIADLKYSLSLARTKALEEAAAYLERNNGRMDDMVSSDLWAQCEKYHAHRIRALMQEEK